MLDLFNALPGEFVPRTATDAVRSETYKLAKFAHLDIGSVILSIRQICFQLIDWFA